jgi:glycosyltransferase involved in cell wall biosynthesis
MGGVDWIAEICLDILETNNQIFMKVLVTSLPDLAKMPPQRPHQLIKHLAAKHDVTVLCTDVWWLDDVHDQYLDEILDGVEFAYVSTRRINSILQEMLFCTNLSVFSKEYNISKQDLHVNMMSPVAGYWISRQFRLPTIFDIYDDYANLTTISPQIPIFLKPFGQLVGRYLLKKNIESAMRITYITEALNDAYKFPDEKARIIPNGVDVNIFYKRDSQKLREELGRAEQFLIGYVGGLKNWVDLKPLLKVLKATKHELDMKLVVIGEEGDFKKNVDLVKEYGVSENVLFTGFVARHRVPDYISAMDICLLPFRVNPYTHNSLPLKLFEYMACEKPVVSSPLRGVKQAVADHVLYANDEATLTKRIKELYNNENERIALGRRGRAFVLEHYSWDSILKQFDSVVQEMLDDVTSQ